MYHVTRLYNDEEPTNRFVIETDFGVTREFLALLQGVEGVAEVLMINRYRFELEVGKLFDVLAVRDAVLAVCRQLGG